MGTLHPTVVSETAATYSLNLFMPEVFGLMSAAQATVHEYPGKADAIAQQLQTNHISKAAHTLLNEVNPLCTNHKYGLVDSVYVQTITQDYRTLQQYAAALNHSVVYLGDFSGISDTELLEAYADWHADIGLTAAEVSRALADRRIEPTEFLAIKQRLHQSLRTGLEFLNRLASVVEDE
ncbi:hypothetical protein NO559_07850 [Dasania sp. GY-MA-18]|uniref:Uncharacterized protein n=1 Tax=Dasania phycosphaerae TaxID=2950436 RepID=A0A9J6RMA2_9GAMM|nr:MULTISPECIES: phage regulatory CII family protein [Dasania]MCR8922679.1 hypothetical protein [Dasania sp. GY-MA-18]MCZ0865109.1 hypothetical protein [Dasania phycosphaerae]MCZ0868835.1 hypothetical protein [Dasania phycosphaerae]